MTNLYILNQITVTIFDRRANGCGGAAARSHAERFPFADKPWGEDTKKMLERIWENDPTLIEAK